MTGQLSKHQICLFIHLNSYLSFYLSVVGENLHLYIQVLCIIYNTIMLLDISTHTHTHIYILLEINIPSL